MEMVIAIGLIVLSVILGMVSANLTCSKQRVPERVHEFEKETYRNLIADLGKQRQDLKREVRKLKKELEELK